jgi:hypothetical protein
MITLANMSNTQKVAIRCLCGSYQLSLAIPKDKLPLAGGICHCDSCRHGCGTLYVGAAYPPTECLENIHNTLYRLRTSVWPDKRTTYLCSTCGTSVYSQINGSLWIHTGTLDQLEDNILFNRQIFVKDTLDGGFSNWLGDLHVETHATRDDKLPTNWPAAENVNEQTIKSPERLHAHCVCKGVEFWIARPSSSSADTSKPQSDLSHQNPDRGDYDIKIPWWLSADRSKFATTCLCTCDSCRLASGCDFVQWAYVPTTDISLSADGSVPFSLEFGKLKAYRSSDRATRYFCGQCGAMVFFWKGHESPGIVNVAVGLFNASEGSLAESWLQWTDEISFEEDGVARAETLVGFVHKGIEEWVSNAPARIASQAEKTR